METTRVMIFTEMWHALVGGLAASKYFLKDEAFLQMAWQAIRRLAYIYYLAGKRHLLKATIG